jgi:hypothetical protein
LIRLLIYKATGGKYATFFSLRRSSQSVPQDQSAKLPPFDQPEDQYKNGDGFIFRQSEDGFYFSSRGSRSNDSAMTLHPCVRRRQEGKKRTWTPMT